MAKYLSPCTLNSPACDSDYVDILLALGIPMDLIGIVDDYIILYAGHHPRRTNTRLIQIIKDSRLPWNGPLGLTLDFEEDWGIPLRY